MSGDFDSQANRLHLFKPMENENTRELPLITRLNTKKETSEKLMKEPNQPPHIMPHSAQRKRIGTRAIKIKSSKIPDCFTSNRSDSNTGSPIGKGKKMFIEEPFSTNTEIKRKEDR